MSKRSKLSERAAGVVEWLQRPEVRRWVLLYRKPLAGFVTAFIIFIAGKIGLDEYLPTDLLAVVTGAIVAYAVHEREPVVTTTEEDLGKAFQAGRTAMRLETEADTYGRRPERRSLPEAGLEVGHLTPEKFRERFGERKPDSPTYHDGSPGPT